LGAVYQTTDAYDFLKLILTTHEAGYAPPESLSGQVSRDVFCKEQDLI
jgi:hypothetical protein